MDTHMIYRSLTTFFVKGYLRTGFYVFLLGIFAHNTIE